MNTADIVKIVKKHKGPVFVGVCLRDDVVYMQAVKADLLYHLESIGDDQAEVFLKDGDLYFTSAS